MADNRFTWLLRTFENLDIHQLYEIIWLRSEVFVVEQDCVYQDIDFKDQKSWHLIGRYNDILGAYARILPPGLHYPEPAIGRVVTHPDVRGTGAGKLLMKQSIDACRELYGSDCGIRIEAQVYLNKFYTDLGFKAVSDNYLLDGIPHVEMLLAALEA